MTPALIEQASLAEPETSAALALPRERLEALVDPGSLQPIRTRVKSRRLGEGAHEADGVITGVGSVEGRPIACYAQDARIAGGSLGEAQADSIVRLLHIARDAGLPVVGFLDSSGARIQEGVAPLAGYARVFREVVALSRQVPQISIVAGKCAGGSAYLPALTDFVIMTEPSAMFLTGPRIVQRACAEDVTVAELGGVPVHERNGVCQLVATDERDAARQARALLSYIPHSRGERARTSALGEQRAGDGRPGNPGDGRPGNPGEERAGDPGALMPPRASAVYDVRAVIATLSDGGHFLETDARWARNMVTGFARIGGHSVGVVANQPRYIGGVIDTHACEKATRFVEQCEDYGLPLVVLVDTPGFMPGTRQERDGIIRLGAGLVRAFAAARVPRFTVILRKAFGGAYIAMNSLHLGATLTYAWPEAEIGIMDARSAVGLIHRSKLAEAADPDELQHQLAEQYRQRSCSAQSAAHDGFIDEIIEPRETRTRLRLALGAFVQQGVGR